MSGQNPSSSVDDETLTLMYKLAWTLVRSIGDDTSRYSREDLVQGAVLRAVDALPAYDPTRGANRKTYIGNKIRWGLIDALRVERGYRRRPRIFETPFTSLLRRDWYDDDYDVHRWMADIDTTGERLEHRDTLEAYTKHLAPEDQLILHLRFCEDMTMKDIGRTIGLSESRISQIITRLLGRIEGRIYRHGHLATA
jgi:RNA polymerase sigma factor (sigma-70 family)